MAEINALTIELNLDSKGLESGLREVKSKFLSALGSIDGSGSRVGSTFEGITNQLQSMGKELSNAGRGVSTLDNSAGTGLASSFNQANESLDRLQQTIAILQSLSIEIDIEIPISSITQAKESMSSLRESFKGVENEVGNSGIAGTIDGIANGLGQLNENNPELLQTATIILGIGLAFANVLQWIKPMKEGLTILVGALGLTSGEVILIAVALAALTAGIIALIQNWDALVLAAQVTWEENIVPIIESAAEAIGSVIGAVGQFIEETFNNAVNFISEKWTSFINFISENVPLVGKLIEGLTPDPEAAQNHPFFKNLKDNPNLNKGGFSGITDNQHLLQFPEIAKKINEANKGVKESTDQAAESLNKMGDGAKEAGDKTENASVKIKITSGSLGTFDVNSKGALDTVNQLTGGINRQLPKLDLQRGALEKNNNQLTELEEKAKKAEESLKKFNDLELNLDLDLLPESEKLQRELQGRLDEIKRLGEEANVSQERILEVQNKEILRSSEEITEALHKEEIERLKNSDSFFDQLKGGFIEFADQVENNGELVSQFFADTLSQMSQNFSDLFFNVITGKFKDLADLAKQAFEAILRAFLDLVSAIATRQIVISIAGLFGVDTKGASAGDVLGIGKQAAGIGLDLAGVFGGGGGAAAEGILGGGAAIGSGISAIGAGAGAAGGATSVGASLGLTGISSVGTGAAGGATGVGASLGLSGISSVPSAPGFLAGIGGITGAITIVGAVLAAAALAFTIIAPLLEKTPRLDIDFDSVKTEAGRRAALVSKLLNDDFLKDEIIDISVKRKAGLGLGGDEGIKDVLADAIQDAVNNLLDIINKLPTDLADMLTDELLNTPLDTETEVAGERLFEFDAKGKKIGEKFNQLINGEIQAKFLFAVDGFLQTMFESLGVLPEAAESFLDKRFEEFKNAGSREARAKVGQELLADINAFVDAFNIVSGNVNDAIGQTIQSVSSLSSELGFEAVPSIGELTDKLGELLENAELDPETVQKYADLRNAIVQGISDIINSITGLIGKISQLNSTIVSLGGSAVNVIPFLDEAQAKLIDFYTTNLGNLSLGEQEMFLDELLGIANAKLAEEQAAFQRAQEARQKAEEAQRARIEKRIDNLNKEKDKINEVFQERIDALNEELRIAEDFAQLTESIRQTLDSILFSPESVLTGVEQVSALQSNIATLQAQLAGTTDPEKQLDIAGRLEEAFKTLFDTAGDAFGVNSPEFVAIFDQVTGGLENLAEFTEGRGRSVEEISAEIERLTAENEATLKSIDAKIEAAQERLANIGQSTADNTFHASQDLQELFEFIRSEYIRILEERFAQLGEVSEFGFATEVEGLGVIAGLADESLTVLKGMGEETASQTGYLSDIAKRLGALAGFQHGSEGLRDFGRGTLAVLHGLEAVITKSDVEAMEQALIGQFASGLSIGSSLSRFHAAQGEESPGLGRRMLLGGGNFIPDIPVNMTGPSTGEPVNHVTEMNVDINVNVNGGSQASIASLAGEIENVMVRSIRQGRVRKELQEAAVRRVA